MADSLVLRGPDDSGEWVDPDNGVALGHRRLSIIDLSERGRQPMVSTSGRYVITYNGEIYNFHDLAGEAARGGVACNGQSDTSVLLATVERLGVARGLEALTGMFAFAVWDRHDRMLYLARDRLGEKPLYFGWFSGVFGFASELKALRSHPLWNGRINQASLASFLRYGYVSGPQSIYEDIYRLPPGCYFGVSPKDVKGSSGFSPNPEQSSSALRPRRYWSLSDAVQHTSTRPSITESEATDELEDRLSKSVQRQLVSDVPLGALLSGGVDSSLVTALMQQHSTDPIKTFTIGFSESRYNEAGYASEVARHLGTDHTELYVTPAEAREVIPLLPDLYDEPFADSSQIPTYLVSKLARSDVTVALSGDAGDELFGGYARYGIAAGLWRKMQLLPISIRSKLAFGMCRAPGGMKAAAVRILAYLADRQMQVNGRPDQFDRFLQLMCNREFSSFYDSLVAHWKNPRALLTRFDLDDEVPRVGNDAPEGAENLYEQMMYRDTLTYLPDDILTKVDRASMGVSLEVRVPLLDHELVEWAWSLPPELKVKQRQGKYLLRNVLFRHVPRELIERPKMGFGVPIDEWLRGPIKDWAEDLLSVEKLQGDGYFHAAPIREMWRDHIAGKGDWHYYLWDILMFQAWRVENP